jgi:hypothetical protein
LLTYQNLQTESQFAENKIPKNNVLKMLESQHERKRREERSLGEIKEKTLGHDFGAGSIGTRGMVSLRDDDMHTFVSHESYMLLPKSIVLSMRWDLCRFVS